VWIRTGVTVARSCIVGSFTMLLACECGVVRILMYGAGIPLHGLAANEGSTGDQILALLQIVKPHIVITDDSPEPADIHVKLAVSAAVKHYPIFAIDSSFVCPLRNLTLEDSEVHLVDKAGMDFLAGNYSSNPTFAAFCKAVNDSATSLTCEFGDDVTLFEATPALLSTLTKGFDGKVSCVDWDTIRRLSSVDDSGRYIGSYSHALSILDAVLSREVDASGLMELIGRFCCEAGGLFHLTPHVSNGAIVASSLISRIESNISVRSSGKQVCLCLQCSAELLVAKGEAMVV
jgi:hypothetical protein